MFPFSVLYYPRDNRLNEQLELLSIKNQGVILGTIFVYEFW